MKKFLYLLTMLATWSIADQPIMNMMPRWDGGYGYQFFYETIERDDLYFGNEIFKKDLNESIQQVQVEGVYTWDRSIRLTAKLPMVLDAERANWINGQKEIQKDKGVGDLTLALPLKKYFNLMKRTGSWTIAPQVRIPLGSKDEYEVADRLWGGALFLGYETETRLGFFSAGVSHWMFESQKPSQLHAAVDIGWNFRDNAQILWETDYHTESEGKEYLSVGPALYWRENDNTHIRLEYDHISRVSASKGVYDHVGGSRIKIGVGFVY